MVSLEFHNPYWLWLLLALPVWIWLQGRVGKPAALEFPSIHIAKAIGVKARSRIGHWFICLRVLTLASLIIALARPQYGRGGAEQSVSGIDIMLAIDLSSSMLALDFSQSTTPITRLEVVRDVLLEFIPKRPHDRLGLVAFAGNPYLVSPLTLNHDWLMRNLERLQIGLIEDGTAIGSGIGMCINHIRDIPAKSRVIILLTDGVNNSGSITPIAAAEAAASFSTKIYTILVGKGGVVPTFYLDPRTNRIALDSWGQPYIVQAQMPIDAQALEEVSRITEGKSYRATDRKALKAIYNEIDTLERSEAKVKHYFEYVEVFWVPLIIALLLGVIEFFSRFTRWKQWP